MRRRRRRKKYQNRSKRKKKNGFKKENGEDASNKNCVDDVDGKWKKRKYEH